MITIDFDSDTCLISFNSDSISQDLWTINRICPIVDSRNRPYDFVEHRVGQFDMTATLFLEYHDLLIDYLGANEHQFQIRPNFNHFLDWAWELLGTDDGRGSLTREEIDEILNAVEWNYERRPPSEFQYRNLMELSNFQNAAIFSVPGAGKTTGDHCGARRREAARFFLVRFIPLPVCSLTGPGEVGVSRDQVKTLDQMTVK